jgi:hypothetical protein
MAEVLSHTDEEINTIQKVDPDYEHKLAKNLAKYENDLGMIRDAVQSELKKDELYYGSFFKDRKKGKDKTTDFGNEDIIPVEAVPGGNKNFNAIDQPEEFFTKSAADLYSKAKSAGSEESIQVLWDVFNNAKEAAATKEGVGAKKYLQKFYGNKWQNTMFMNITGFKALLEENKRSSFNMMHDTDDYIKDKTNDVRGWGDVAKTKYNADMAKADLKKFSANSEIDYFQSGVKSVLNNMSATKEYKYAKYLPNKYGQINLTDDIPQEFTKAYLNDNNDADVDDVLDAYGATKKEFYRQYVLADKTSIEQGKGLTGLGMKGGKGITKTVNSNDPEDEFNNALISTTNQGFGNPGAVKIIIGNAGKDNYDINKESDPNASGFIADFALKIRSRSTPDKKKPLYRMLAQGIAADDDVKSSFTIYPTKEDVDEYFGDSKEVKESGVKERIMSEGISYVYDNTKIASPISEFLNVSPIEKQLLSKGSYRISEFVETAGTVKLSYDGKITTVTSLYKLFDNSEQGYSLKEKIYVVPNIKKVQEVVDQQIIVLEDLQQYNLNRQQEIRLANKSKTQN